MPTHVYIPTRTPPRWFDRVLVHPFDNAIGVLCVLFGAVMVASLLMPGYHPSASLLRMPVQVGLVVSTLLAFGGVLSLTGLHWSGETVSRGWHLERLGWLFVTGGLAGHAIAVGWHFPEATVSWLTPTVLATAALLRWWSLILIERNTRRTLSAVQAEVQGAAE